MTRKTSSRTRFASIFLALALVMNLVPLSAFATKDENGTVDANAELTSVNGQVSGENTSNADKANGEVGDENAANAANAASGADANGESVSEPVASYTVRITLPEEGIALRGGQSDELLTQTVSDGSAIADIFLVSAYEDEPFDESYADAFNAKLFNGTGLTASCDEDGIITISGTPTANVAVNLEDAFAGDESVTATDTSAIYVSSSGNDSTGDGSEASPYATISQAYTAVADGGTIYLLSDVDVSVQITFGTAKTVTITSADSNNVKTIYSKIQFGYDNKTMMTVTAGEVIFKNITIDGTGQRQTATSSFPSGIANSPGCIYVTKGGATATLDAGTTIQNFWKNNGTSGGSSVLKATVGGAQINIKDGALLTGCVLEAGTTSDPSSVISSGTGGIVYMTGGTVTGNTLSTTQSASTAIVNIGMISTPHFWMTGGTISGNTINNGAAAVYMRGEANDCDMQFGDTAYVYDNYVNGTSGDQRNIYLKNDKDGNENSNVYVKLCSALSDNAKLGVYAEKIGMGTKVAQGGGVSGVGTGSYTATAADTTYFVSDKATDAEILYCGGREATCGLLQHKEDTTHEQAIYLSVSPAVTATKSTTNTNQIDLSIARCTSDATYVVLDKDMKPVTGKTLTGGAYETDGNTFKLSDSTTSTTIDMAGLDKASGPYTVMLVSGTLSVGDDGKASTDNLTDIATVNIVNFAGDGVKWSDGTNSFENGDFDIVTVPHNDQTGKATKSYTATTKTNYTFAAENAITASGNLNTDATASDNDDGSKTIAVEVPAYGTTSKGTSNYNTVTLTGTTTINTGVKLLDKTGGEELTVKDKVASKTYDGVAVAHTSGSVDGATLSYTWQKKNLEDDGYTDIADNAAPSDAGEYNLKVTVKSSADSSEELGAENLPFTLSKKPLAMTATAQDKTYNGKADATVDAALDKAGVVGTDDVALDTTGVTASFDTKGAGESKPVTLSGEYKLSGKAAGNYTLKEQPSNLKASINKKGLTATIKAEDKTYDGNATATVTSTLTDVVEGDDGKVTAVVANPAFADKNAGTDKKVTASVSLSGDAAVNYTVNATAETTATISSKEVSITGVTVKDSKTYDKSTAATITNNGTIDGKVETDNLAITVGQAVYGNENVGTNKTVTFTGFALAGTDANNYKLKAQPASTTADITAKEVSISGVTIDATKVYDGNADAKITDNGTLTGVEDGDTVAVKAGTATYSDKNVGDNKAVTFAGFGLEGTDAANYTLKGQPADTAAAIAQREVAVSGLSATKTYDGDDTAEKSEITGTPVVGNKALDADDVSLNTDNMTGTFNSADADKATTVTLAGLSLTGTDATNYKLPKTVTCTGTITKADGAGTVKLEGWTYGDKANAPQPTSATNGTDKVTYRYKLKGAADSTFTATVPTAAGSYTVKATFPATGNHTETTATADFAIAKKALTVTATANDKTYDGGTTATLKSATLNGMLDADKSAVSLDNDKVTVAFADKNAGDSKAVTASVTDGALTGDKAGNYAITTATAANAKITPKTVTATITAENKTYNGSAEVTVSASTLTDVISGDSVSAKASNAKFADGSGVGDDKAVTADIALAGDDAANYALTSTTASTTANITAKELSVTVSAENKAYDGTTDATATVALAEESGIVGEDTVTLDNSSMKAAFDTATVGNNKTVTVNGLKLTGTSAKNYKLPDSITAKANITQSDKGSGTVTIEGWTYGETAKTPIANSTTNPETATDKITYQYKAKDAADDTYTATVPADAGTYTVKATFAANDNYAEATATADFTIGPKALTVSVAANNKTYDGTTTAELNDAALVGVVEADADRVTLEASGVTAAFDSKDAGTDKPVTLTGSYALSGDAAKNYTVAQPTGLTANIAAAPLTITAATVAPKNYDGNDGATVTGVTFEGLKNGETLAANTDYTVSDAKYDHVNATGNDAATKIDFKVALVDTDLAKNYTLASNAGSQSTTIGKASHIDNKLSTEGYRSETNTFSDLLAYVVAGGTVGTVATADESGILDGKPTYDSTTGELTYKLKSTATEGQTATVTLPVTSTNYNDYNIFVTVGVTAKEKAEIGITGENYEYNGTAQAPTDITVTDNKVQKSALEVTYEGADGTTYSKSETAPTNAGKYVMTVKVPDSNNKYTGSATCAFEITKKPLTATITAKDKTYDGNATATVTSTLSGVVGNDDVAANVTNPAFADKNMGEGKTVAAAITLSGDAANNYTVNAEATTTASISVKEVSIVDVAVEASKTYDKSTAATITNNGTIDGKVETDNLAITVGQAAYDNANVGTNKTVSFTGFALVGDDANNYKLKEQPTSTKADITAKALTLTIKANDKKLDGSDAAVLDTENATFDGMVSGDTVSVDSAKGAFENCNTASDTAVVKVTDVKLKGDDAGNYEIVKINSVTAKLIPLSVTFMDGDAKLGEKMISVYGTAPAEVISPEKSGYYFAGWYTDEECTTPWNSKTGVTVDATVYAKWSADALYTLSGVVKQGDAAKSDVSVTLYEGSAGIAATTTDANGMYSFGNVPNGTYTIAAKASDRAATTTVAVQDGDITQDMVLPATAVATEVQVAPGAPAATVSGIDEALVNALIASDGNEVTAPKDGERLEVKLNVKADASDAEKAAIQEKGSDGTSWDFVNMDVDWSKYNLDGHIGSGNIADTVNVLAIRIPYDRDDKRDIVVYRHHMNGTTAEVTKFTQLQSEPDEASYTDGTCYVGDDYIVLYTQKFSAFGIGYINDATDPVISGAEDGKSYCGPVTLTITDEEIAYVTVNGKKVSLDADGRLTLNAADGEQTVVAVDAARHSSSITVTVNDGHTYGEWESNGDGTHSRVCSVDAHVETQNCSGGVATCSAEATCEVCGGAYGEVDLSNHAALKHVDAKAATTDDEGNIEYWYCEDCGKYFKDAEATKEIAKADTVTAKLSKEAAKADTASAKPKSASTSNTSGSTSKTAAKTGDEIPVIPWAALLLASGGAGALAALVGRKRKHDR